MIRLRSVWLMLAAAVSVAFSVSGSARAQTEGPRQTAQVAVESAAPALPEAPRPQNGSPAAPPDAAPAQGSSSSAQSAPGASAQSTAPAGAAAPASDTPADANAKHTEAERELKVEESQRLLGVMPQFQVVMGGAVVPLTPGEKMRLALHSAIDPFYIGYAFVVSGGYGELVDSHPGFGWGPGGYFKRVGAGYADNVNGAIIGNALLPIVLHQDPRYFRLGTGSFGKRFLYAALSTVVCHGDDGKRQPNVSNVLGNFISGAISNAYYPANERGLGLTFENGAEVTAYGAVGGQILEFGPDLARRVHRHKKPAPPGTPVAPAGMMPAAPAGTPAPANPPGH